MYFSYDSRQKRGAVDPEYYINQNKNIRTFYDPENPNYNEKDILEEKKAKMRANVFYSIVIVICLVFFGVMFFMPM